MITEFMAANDRTLADGDGHYSDWIELHNPSSVLIGLRGWRLRAGNDTWTFPAASLAPGAYLVVFASGQSGAGYIDGLGHLHTTFRLDADGEPLALLDPKGGVAFDFPGPIPRQREDISYGLKTTAWVLVTGASPARLLVTGEPVDDAWRGGRPFDDSAWLKGDAAAGFNLDPGPVLGNSGVVTAYRVTVGTAGTQDYGGTLGMDFVVHETLRITALGVFDDSANGLATTLTAQLWARDDRGTPTAFGDDFGQAVLATAVFTPEDPGRLEGGSRFKALATPLTLPPGSYTIVAYGYNGAERNGNIGTGGNPEAWETDTAQGAIEFVGGSRYGSAGVFPSTVDGGPADRYAAGTFQCVRSADPDIRTDLASWMAGRQASVHLRIPFDWVGNQPAPTLVLRMGYDDGFVAWLNGVELARRNAPVELGPGARATAAGNTNETISLALPSGVLLPGANLLALQGLNLAAADRDFIVVPHLTAVRTDPKTAGYFRAPTPGAPNDTNWIDGFVEAPRFSVPRGFFTEPVALVLECPTTGATIRFTTDGSAPAESHGRIYEGPLQISTTTVIRAAAFAEGRDPSPTETHTYLFLDAVAQQGNTPPGYPATWAGFAADYGMVADPAAYARAAGDPRFTPAEARAAVVASLRALPSLCLSTAVSNLFDPATGLYLNPGARGEAWERPVSAEWLLPDGTSGFQINAGLQIMGWTSRSLASTPKLNFRLLFERKYGPGMLHYPVFGPTAADRYNSIALRANSRDTWVAEYSGFGSALYLADQWAKEAQLDMGQPAPHGRFVHLYLNGLYWGIYNPTERPDAAFAASYLGGDRLDYDVIKFCCPHLVEDGDMAEWTVLLNSAWAALGTDAAYQHLQGNNPDGSRNPALQRLVDVDNLIDFIINGQFHASVDWPGNYYVGRYDVDPVSTGFKFFQWDNDLAFSGGDPNANKVQTDPGSAWWQTSPGALDIALRANAEYRLRFADRVYRHYFHHGALTVASNIARWKRIASALEPALYAESARWGDSRAPLRTVQDHWRARSDTMLSRYFPARNDIVLAQLRAHKLYPELDAPEFSQEGGVVPPGFRLGFTADAPVYFTRDGEDPRLPGGGIRAQAERVVPTAASEPLLVAGAPVRAWVPADDQAGLEWIDPGFDDAQWLAGQTGVGYDTQPDYLPHISLNVDRSMRGQNATIYLRLPFTMASTDGIQHLRLRLKYDDGFVAYLNGTRVASANAPSNLAWNSGATANHDDTAAVVFAEFDLTSHVSLLHAGDNLLAIHGLNAGAASSDFLLVPELHATRGGAESSAVLSRSGRIRARAFDGREWSALHEVEFIVGNAATAGRLLLSEINYHPAPPSPEERQAGFTDPADFEFLELANVTPDPLDLTGLRFVQGIEFDWTNATRRTLAPGECALVVANRDAFRMRYGPGPDQGVVGSFARDTHLRDSGERLVLLDATGSAIFDLVYGDRAPWPASPDGDGPTLVFDGVDGPQDPGAWRASLQPGGTPGRYLPFRAEWNLAWFSPEEQTDPAVTGDQADPDGDGVVNLLEFACGTNPRVADAPESRLQAEWSEAGADGTRWGYLTLRFHRARNSGLAFALESSPDLTEWAAAAGEMVIVTVVPNRDGGWETVAWRTPEPIGPEAAPHRYWRLRVRAP